MRRLFVLTLILMPITVGIWYAAGTLFAAPAVWLTDFLLSNAYPNIVEAAGLQGVEMMVCTQFGEDGGDIMASGLASILGKDLLLIVGAPFFQRARDVARRPDCAHVAIQRAPDADFGAFLPLILATAMAAAMGGPRC